MDMQLLPKYLVAVARHGWLLGFAIVGGIGNAATVWGDVNVPRWVWWTVIVVGLLGAQFKAYCDVMTELATVRARLRELDTVEAKRAFIDEAISDAQALKAAIESTSSEDWWQNHHEARFTDRLSHYEREVAVTLSKAFPAGTERHFGLASASGNENDMFGGGAETGEDYCAYIDRRIERLTEIKNELG